MKISQIDAFQIFDSRGNPTVEAVVTLENGITGHGLVPSGASTGQFEAWELRDGDPDCFRGKSVRKAMENIRTEIANVVKGLDVHDQHGLDDALIAADGSPNKARLGANAILGVSMAAAKAAANDKGIPLYASLGEGTVLPLPEIQIFGGGAHANWRTDVQDFLVIATGAKTYEETLEITFHVFHAAGEIMRARGHNVGAADEGGFWPEFSTNEEALETLHEALRRVGFTPGVEASLSLDVAASDLYDSATRRYRFGLENRQFTSSQFSDLMAGWCEKYAVVSIEDPMADSDWEGWERVHAAIGKHVQLIGDDLFTTNAERITEGIRRNVANAVLIKLNQIGTVTETMDAIRLTQAAGWAPVVSARSGETEDTFISHLAVATNAGQLKVGSFCRSERMAKWNEILRIGRHLGSKASFAGKSALAQHLPLS
ncbi:MAG: phosphopyruvate hydratase [Terrimicrobiaceae bacterium]